LRVTCLFSGSRDGRLLGLVVGRFVTGPPRPVRFPVGLWRTILGTI
jgi:hypothetical protein